ncbi:MAG: radical SAM protein [Thermotogae bacterium]|nr:radical SAM protein [Thermotogota bacterium]
MSLRYVYGPVPSRRLGRSIGVSPIPPKTCNYSCIYCQLGRTTRMTNKRREFFPLREILQEVSEIPKDKADVITIVGEGEPTLYSKLGELILGIRQRVDLPVVVITNGGLLCEPEVKKALSFADVVLPSLDAWDEKSFRRINRPHPSLNFDRVVEGLKTFTQEFRGEVWLEVMLMKNVNDDDAALLEIRKIAEKVSPKKIYLNVPIRPPAESWVKPPDPDVVRKAAEVLNAIALDFLISNSYRVDPQDAVNGIVSIIKRHPMTEPEIMNLLGEVSDNPEKLLEGLRKHPKVILKRWRSMTFYHYKP